MIDFAALAASAVAILAPLLGKAAEKGFEKAGESVSEGLFETLKHRLTGPAAQEALEDLTKQPGDADAQGAVRLQLRKALEADPSLVTELQRLIDGAQQRQVQRATASDHSSVIQIQGTNNSVAL